MSPSGAAPASNRGAPKELNQQRDLAIDVFRGMTVALMIVVNSLGSPDTYSPLLHADWHGFTLTDLVFPTFLFVVGNAMSFTQQKYEQVGEAAFFAKVLKRTLIIFLIGYLLFWLPFFRQDALGAWSLKPFSHTRVFGVLQRIALCYFIASLTIHWLKLRGALVFGCIALVAHWLILTVFGDLSMPGNAGTRLDLWLLGPDHLYHGEGVAFDPEGLLGTLPATVNVIGGYVAGIYLQRRGRSYETIARMLLAGVALVSLAVGWDLLLPINKKLWTSSYVLLTVGIDLCVLAWLIFAIDMAGRRNWTRFFEVFGRNALVIFVLSEFLVIALFRIPAGAGSLYGWIYAHAFQSWAGDRNGSPLFAIAIMLICWAVGKVMDRRKLYVKV